MSTSPITVLFESATHVETLLLGGDSEVRAWTPSAAPKAPEPGPVAEEPAESTEQELLWAAREATLLAEIEAAFERGKAAGEAARDPEVTRLQADLQAAAATIEGALREGLSELAAAAATLTIRCRREAVGLGLAVARAVVGDTLRDSAEALEAVVSRALEAVPRTDEATIRLHPTDLARLGEVVGALEARRGDPIKLRLAPSPSMSRGGCIIEFEQGSVDARPETALKALEEAVEAALSDAHREVAEPGERADSDEREEATAMETASAPREVAGPDERAALDADEAAPAMATADAHREAATALGPNETPRAPGALDAGEAEST